MLQLLHADKRREYLYQLQEFMVTDNSRNWRFRYELAEYVAFSSSSLGNNHILFDSQPHWLVDTKAELNLNTDLNSVPLILYGLVLEYSKLQLI